MLDLISFLLIAFFSNYIIGEASNIVGYLNQNQIPATLFAVLILQFTLIIVERVIYVLRAIHAKLILNYVLIVFYHAAFFFLIPVRLSNACCASIDVSDSPKPQF